MKAAKPATPHACAIGRWPTARPTKRWAFTRAGVSAPIRSPRWSPRSDPQHATSQARRNTMPASPAQFVWQELITTDPKAAERFYHKGVAGNAHDASQADLHETAR